MLLIIYSNVLRQIFFIYINRKRLNREASLDVQNHTVTIALPYALKHQNHGDSVAHCLLAA